MAGMTASRTVPTTAWVAAVVAMASNLIPIGGILLLSWPIGNAIAMFGAETLALAGVAWAAVRRASGLGHEVSLPDTSGGRVGVQVLGWGLIVAVVLVVMAGIAWRAGVELSAIAIGVPLLTVLVRSAVEAVAVLRHPAAQAGGAARVSVTSVMVRIVAIVGATFLLLWLKPEGLGAMIGVAVALLFGIKALLDGRLSFLAAAGGTPRMVPMSGTRRDDGAGVNRS
jgi:hypothetical protein